MFNRKNLALLLTTLFLFVMSGCQNNDDLSDMKKQDAKNYQEAIKVAKEYFSGYLNGDLEKSFSLLDVKTISLNEDGIRQNLEEFSAEANDTGLLKFEIINDGVIKYEDKYVVQTKVYLDSGEVGILPIIVQKQEDKYLILLKDFSEEDMYDYVKYKVLVPDPNSRKF